MRGIHRLLQSGKGRLGAEPAVMLHDDELLLVRQPHIANAACRAQAS